MHDAIVVYSTWVNSSLTQILVKEFFLPLIWGKFIMSKNLVTKIILEWRMLIIQTYAYFRILLLRILRHIIDMRTKVN